MSVFDKIKNALFEEEYVEVEEKPRVKPKKDKIKNFLSPLKNVLLFCKIMYNRLCCF